MAWTCTTTEARRTPARTVPACLAAVVLLLGGPAVGHEPPKQIRELIRIQGYRSPAPAGVDVDRELTLTVLGKTLPFAATDWRAFLLGEAAAKSPPKEPTAISLQGERTLLSRINAARAGQQITVLAERRPGAVDAFVLTVDLCPR